MKTLTLTQPWASLMALGLKRVETRSWATRYRGPLAIHAAKGFPASARQFAGEEHTIGRLPESVPFGAILCILDLVDCQPTTLIAPKLSNLELLYGDYAPGRWAWLFRPDSLCELEVPLPVKGSLGLWEWAADPWPVTIQKVPL